jgi:FHS family L-fucose permease-like MFS transporter
MMIFCCSRFICTYLLKYIRPGKLLWALAVVAAVLVAGVIGFNGVAGLYCLVGVSASMSLMFPTIYGMALDGLGDDAKFGAAGLVMAILGGSVLPPVQARIIDMGTVCSWPAVNLSFVLPLVCFIVVGLYGYRWARK